MIRKRGWILVATLFLTFVPQASALHWSRIRGLCLDVDLPQEIWREDIPVGCEIVDCCPGCPGPPMIDWRIRVERGMRGATLRFEGLDARQLGALKVTGNAKLSNGVFTLGAGETIISGLPRGERGKVAVGRLEGTPDAGDTSPASGVRDTGIEVVQTVGGRIVNRTRSSFVFRPCGKPELPEDKIRVTNNTGPDSTIILADYRQGGTCRNDRVHRATSQVGIGNAISNGPCNSDVSVFSDGNAMSFETGVTTWTASPTNVHTVNLRPILTAPVTIWLARPGAALLAANDLANANLLYDRNNVGVRFNAVVNDVSANANAVATIGTGCVNAGTVLGSAFFTPGRLNVYYVSGAFTGINCNASFNVNYIGTTANIASLPHEFGHAYGMRPVNSDGSGGGHVNPLPGFGNENIMFAGGPATRDRFTVGQAFRLNVHTPSMLNTNGTRTGPTRNCLPMTTSNICPALDLDAQPH